MFAPGTLVAFVVVVCTLFVPLACQATEDARRPAPDFALPDLQGRLHRLTELRGRIVVLEWTDHRCPTVAGHHDHGIATATRRQVRGDDLVWWSIDSSRPEAGRHAAIAAWRAANGHDLPWLLDADGAVARAFGAQRTPHLFVVDATGHVAYAGAWTDRDREVDYVAAAVAALRAGRPVRPATTTARGCEIDQGERAPATSPVVAPASGALPAPTAAWTAFQLAAVNAAAGRPEPALTALAAALAGGYPTPGDVLAAPSFAALRADDAARRRVDALLRRHAIESRLTMVAADEPGEPLLLLGEVRDDQDRALPGALVRVWHTDARGIYSAAGEDEPRLFAWVRTDGDGCFALRTIRPAAYPDQEIDQHVHFTVAAEGHLQVERRIGFADDPVWGSRPSEPRPWVMQVERDDAGLSRCRFVLRVP